MAITINLEGLESSAGSLQIRQHRVLVDRPEEKGGSDRGPLGGEYLIAGLAGCFYSNLVAAAEARAIELSNIRIQASGELDGMPAKFTSIKLTVNAQGCEHGLLEKLCQLAEKGCIVANTLKTALSIEIAVV